MSVPEKHHDLAKREKIDAKFAVITVSTSRYKKMMSGSHIEDISGDLAQKIIEESGYKISYRDIIADNKKQILDAIEKAIKKSCNIMIFIGGTGISRTDITTDTLENIFERKIPGFGEIFRYLSYSEIGSAAILSRATAGIYKTTIIFALPGSPNAVSLALKKLIIPEIKHMLYLAFYKDKNM
ncbi:MAG: molybdenum cofactor biosynthesis protein B [Candidatus Njordarchaeota archaeon]